MSDIPKELDNKARTALAASGVEMTPDEFKQVGKSALAKIREGMKRKGFDIPESDIELIAMMAEASRFNRRQEAAIEHPKQRHRPWWVVYAEHPVAMFASDSSANRDAYDRNNRATRLGVSARYKVEFIDEATKDWRRLISS